MNLKDASKSNMSLNLSCSSLNECLSQRDNYQAIFDSMNEGLFIVSHDQTITMCNRSFTKITGISQKDVINRTITELFCNNQECDLYHSVMKTIKTSRPCREETIRILRGDGSTCYAVFSTSILRNMQGEATGIVVVFRDISVEEDLKKKLYERYQFHQIIGKSKKMQEMYQLIEDVASTTANVLILGESGTGKELVANALHYHSTKSNGPFIKVSCAALSEPILESELFGHVKGSFTGAYRDKPGRFELANGGTIFLDEIGEVGTGIQVKLLRALQEKEIERVGDTHTRKVDVRIIAATNKDLKQLISKNLFREDLYYRLKVITVDLPPLRQRREDIPLLTRHFINRFASQYKKKIKGVDLDTMDLLMEYNWRGNVRELENAIEHAFVKTKTSLLLPNDLPPEVQHPSAYSFGEDIEINFSQKKSKLLGKTRLLQALNDTGWNQSKAARKLKVDRSTVWRNMKKYHIVIPEE